MKRVFFCLVSLLFFAVCAGMPADYSDWRFTGDFRIYHHNKLTPEDAAAAVYGKPVRKLECKILPSLENSADFNALFGYAEPVSRRIAVVVNRIETAKAGRIQFGVGADWLMVVYVDGKKVLDTREMGGNGSAPAKKIDHVVDVELARGVHTVSFWISSGSTTWSVAAGKIPYTKVIYPAGKLKYGPYITDVSNNGAVVSFITEHPAPSGIALRKRGDKEFRNCWSHSGYQIDPNKRVHRINVDGLEPDTVYEYKITFLERPDNRQVYHDRLFSFRTAAQGFKPFKIFVTGDLQYLDDKQCSILDKYMSTSHAAASDFFISLGDTRGAFNSFEKDFFDVALKAVLEKSNHSKNILIVRGNHEYRGTQTYLFSDYFAMKNGKTYGVYLYNDVAFIVLDCGNANKTSRPNTRHYSAYDLSEQLLQEQRVLLGKAVKSAAYKNAKYRVVLAHGFVYGGVNTMSINTRKIVEGIIPEKDIHLWLAGHIHCYRRTVPGKEGFYGFSPSNAREHSALNGKYPYVTMIIDGPGSVKPHSGHTVEFLKDGISVKSFFEDGRVFDSFTLDKNGRLISEECGKDLKYFNVK